MPVHLWATCQNPVSTVIKLILSLYFWREIVAETPNVDLPRPDLTTKPKKSLTVTVNHVLNVVNAATLAVILVVGMFYANPDNWEEFMPFGMTGVLRVSSTIPYLGTWRI